MYVGKVVQSSLAISIPVSVDDGKFRLTQVSRLSMTSDKKSVATINPFPLVLLGLGDDMESVAIFRSSNFRHKIDNNPVPAPNSNILIPPTPKESNKPN